MSLEAWGDCNWNDIPDDTDADNSYDWAAPFWLPYEQPPRHEYSTSFDSDHDNLFIEHSALIKDMFEKMTYFCIGDLLWFITAYGIHPHILGSMECDVTFKCAGYVNQNPTIAAKAIRMTPLMLPMEQKRLTDDRV